MSATRNTNRPEPAEPKLLWNLKETCLQLNLSRSTVLALAYDGNLPSVTIGRRRMFPSNKVKDWAASLPGAAPLQWEEIRERDDLELRQMWSKTR
jgi:excisionase family DNA binding protein